MTGFTPLAERLWRNLGPAFRDAVATSVWCSHCRESVEAAELGGAETPGGLLLRGTCTRCGGVVQRFVEIETPVASPARDKAGDRFRFAGLDSRAACRLVAAGYRTREEVLAAVQAGHFDYGSPHRPRYFGHKCYLRVLEWLGLPVPRPHRLGRKREYTDKQGQYLAFIHYYTKVNGQPPAEADFQRYFQVTPPTVHTMLVTLTERGWIAREPGRARSIALRLPRQQLPDLE
jgi:hypothetical protein